MLKYCNLQWAIISIESKVRTMCTLNVVHSVRVCVKHRIISAIHSVNHKTKFALRYLDVFRQTPTTKRKHPKLWTPLNRHNSDIRFIYSTRTNYDSYCLAIIVSWLLSANQIVLANSPRATKLHMRSPQ